MTTASINAIISGGASGLGWAVARDIIRTGGQVVLLDNHEKHGAQAAKTLGENTLFIPTDVRDEAAVRDSFARAKAHLGEVRLCVNCAGVVSAGRALGRHGPLALETFRAVVDINLGGTFNIDKAAADIMQHNSPDSDGARGVIINTASVAAFDGQIGQAAYSASKGGVAAMTLPLAREFASLGIRVMTIAPGTFDTPMMAAMRDDVKATLAQSVPFPSRLGRPEEYAALVRHIYDNPMLNGETIRLDGAIRMPPQ